MTIEKAIEIINDIVCDNEDLVEIDKANALQLGIEALKAIKGARYYPLPNSLKLLPGETKE